MKLLALKTVPVGAEVLVTATGPAPAPGGTFTLIFFDENDLTVAATPSKLTVELALKPTPLIVTSVPAAPLFGVTSVTDSVGVNFVLLVTVATGVVSEIFPTRAPSGTIASTCVEDSTLKLAVSLPNSTRLTAPRALPSIVTALPVIPELGVKPASFGTFETTTALGAESAGGPTPAALPAVSCTRIVAPTSLAVSLYVCPVAPLIAAQPAPDALQRSH